MKMANEIVKNVDIYKYLGSVLHKNSGYEEYVKNRIKFGWIKW